MSISNSTIKKTADAKVFNRSPATIKIGRRNVSVIYLQILKCMSVYLYNIKKGRIGGRSIWVGAPKGNLPWKSLPQLEFCRRNFARCYTEDGDLLRSWRRFFVADLSNRLAKLRHFADAKRLKTLSGWYFTQFKCSNSRIDLL